jgi:uncharacterized protein YceH (UPF0502 family)
MLPSVYELDPAATAAITVLMLRGPQTIGEIRGRTDRLYDFESLVQVQEMLDALTRRNEPLVVKLERQAGQKDARYAHLLSGEVDIETVAVAPARDRSAGDRHLSERVEKLEQDVERLSAEIESLSTTLQEFRKQFE